MAKIALVHNLKKAKSKEQPVDYFSEFDSPQTVEAIASALGAGGHEVSLVEAKAGLFDWLRLRRPNLVFNIAEGCSGLSREAQVPAILDFLDIPYTGSGVLAQVLSLDKAKAKQIFRQNGIPTPRWQLFKSENESRQRILSFPLMVKPNCEGSAKGIHASSVVRDQAALYAEIARIRSKYAEDVLVEEFIDGLELTVGILGNQPPRILPILEIDFTNCRSKDEFFYSWEVKEYQGIDPEYPDPDFFCPARISPEQEAGVKKVALEAHQVLDCSDLSRVDIRLSSDSIPYVLEVNTLPGLDPEESNLPRMARAAKISYPDLINQILESALQRYQMLNTSKREMVRGVK